MCLKSISVTLSNFSYPKTKRNYKIVEFSRFLDRTCTVSNQKPTFYVFTFIQQITIRYSFLYVWFNNTRSVFILISLSKEILGNISGKLVVFSGDWTHSHTTSTVKSECDTWICFQCLTANFCLYY